MAHALHVAMVVVAALHVGCASSAPEAEEAAPTTVTERRALLAAVRTDDGVYHLRLSGRRGAVRLPVDLSAAAPVGSMAIGPLPEGTPVKVEHVRRGSQPLFGLEGPPRLSARTDGELYLVSDGQLTRLMALPFDEPGAPQKGPPRRGNGGPRAPDATGAGSALVTLPFTIVEVVASGIELLIGGPLMILTIFLLI